MNRAFMWWSIIPVLLLQACGGEEGRTERSEADSATQQVVEESGGGGHEEDEHAEEAQRVTLSDTALRTAGIKTDTVTSAAVAGGRTLVVPGQVQFDPRRVALVSPRVDGRIEELLVVQGDRVRGGQTVATLYSPEFITAQNDLLQAHRRAGLLSGTEDSAGATALADAATRRLRALGVSERAVARLRESGQPGELLPLVSPLNGTITESQLLPGAAVEAGAAVFKVSDLSVLDVVAEVPEQSLPMVQIGQRASVEIPAYPGMSFHGDVERMSGELNPETRTVQAVVHVPNRGGRLRAGMFATVRLIIPERDGATARRTALSVPASAVVTEGDRRFVFVAVGPNTFERREVEVSSLTPTGSMAPADGRLAVERGLRPGERVVIEGAFTLKSELAKASLGEHGH